MSDEWRCKVTVSLHPWCRDVERREDNRQGPLPTLEEAIATITHKGDGMATKAEIQQAAYRAEASQRVKIDLPPSPEPSVARVTLEFTGGHRAHPTQWPWDLILSGACVVRREPGESVRVVEEPERLEARASVLQAAVESARSDRDAAIRERDAIKSDLTSFQNCWHVSRAANDVLKARVAKLEGEKAEAIRERDRVREDAKADHNIAKAALDERDTAIRERGALKDRVAELEAGTKGLRGDVKAAEKDNERLREQLESVADRAAAAETALEAAPAASGAAGTEAVGSEVVGYAVKQGKFYSERLHSNYGDAWGVAGKGTVVPLYAAPQSVKGWLTPEEREALTWWCGSTQPVDIDQLNAWCAAIRNLLARSSPPEVVLPVSWTETNHINRVMSAEAVIAALAAAGVPVKEVGRE